MKHSACGFGHGRTPCLLSVCDDVAVDDLLSSRMFARSKRAIGVAQSAEPAQVREPLCLPWRLGRMLGCPREYEGENQVNQGVVAEPEGFEPSIRLYKRITV